MPIQSYRDLEVWQSGRNLAKEVYGITSRLPASERYGFASQMRRAVTSVPANIAEGWARHYTAEFVQFLRSANGSLAELETHLILASDLGLILQEEAHKILEKTNVLGRQLLALERSLQRRANQS